MSHTRGGTTSVPTPDGHVRQSVDYSAGKGFLAGEEGAERVAVKGYTGTDMTIGRRTEFLYRAAEEFFNAVQAGAMKGLSQGELYCLFEARLKLDLPADPPDIPDLEKKAQLFFEHLRNLRWQRCSDNELARAIDNFMFSKISRGNPPDPVDPPDGKEQSTWT